MTGNKHRASLESAVAISTIKADQVQLFDEQESELVSRALVLISKAAPQDAEVLSGLLGRLAETSKQIFDTPSLDTESFLASQSRDGDSLISHLCGLDGLEGDLALPTKAILQRSFLLRKIQFFRGFVKATSAAAKTIASSSKNRSKDQSAEIEEGRQAAGPMKRASLDLREEYAQSVYTLMAEELLLALLRKPTVTEKIKIRAARQLIAIWDSATLEIDEFCPLLESAWHARNRVNVGLGSLLGASEYFRLVAEQCDPRFLDFFEREEVSPAENQAFTEFLFGLTYEEYTLLQDQMDFEKKKCVTSSWASKVLNRPIEQDCSLDEINPLALYRSYSRRQLASDFRILADTDGPRRTAEAYLMVYLLDQQP